MNKVGIITCGKEPNYGACLQAFATYQMIKSLGFDVELMNYSFFPDRDYSPFYQPTVKSALVAAIFYFSRKAQSKAFTEFRQKYMRYSKERLYKVEDFEKIKKEYSCFVTGSDQVWNPDLGIDINITLQSFVTASDDIKSISYASSFGSKYLAKELHEFYAKQLEKFKAISVREVSGVSIVDSLLKTKCSRMVCDPVMLFDDNFWGDYCDNSRNPQNKYVLIYDMRHSNEVMSCAIDLAKHIGCEVIAISRIKMLKKGIRFVNDLSPSQFLSYIKNAEAIVTDSFHGTIFSILFHKEFYSFCSGEGAKIGERIISILDYLNLKSRLYERSRDVKYKPIDYYDVEPKIKQIREDSIAYLKEALTNE